MGLKLKAQGTHMLYSSPRSLVALHNGSVVDAIGWLPCGRVPFEHYIKLNVNGDETGFLEFQSQPSYIYCRIWALFIYYSSHKV